MSLTREAGNASVIRPYTRLVVTVILRPTFGAPGWPLPRKRRCGLAWYPPHGPRVPFIHPGRCRAEDSSDMVARQGGGMSQGQSPILREQR
jgi:hypothetical protein